MMKKVVISLCLILFSLVSFAQEIKKDKHLDSLAKKIYFQHKELYFKRGSLEAMKEIIVYIKNNDKYYLLECHTSRDGLKEENQLLSEKIAGMIERTLINLGLDTSRFTVIGKGELFPCCHAHTRAERYKNRRIEIKEVSEEEIKQLKKSKK